MTLVDQIQECVEKLPAPSQTEVLDFAQYLLAKLERQEARDWENLSLANALRGMEDEPSEYSSADLLEIFE